jgi:uncharacterized protein (DUF58 family)
MDAVQTKTLLNRVRRLDIRTRRLMNDSVLGEYHSVFKGRGMDFDEVREYVAGDEVRTIDWNVTARTGHPFVKKYTEERELTLLLMVDISASGNFGGGSQSKRELAAEVASLLALSAIRNRDRVGLLLFSDRIEQYVEPKKGRRHVLRVVREILFHEAKGRGTAVLKALEVAGHVLHRRAIVFLISDFQSNEDAATARPALRRALRQTNRRHDLIAVHIEDARERELPDVGLVSLEDAETGDLVELDTADPVVRRRFSEQAAAHTEEVLGDLRREGLDALQLTTGAPYLPALQRFFKSRGRARA